MVVASNESGEADFPDVSAAHTALIEALVSADDTFMEKYLVGELSKDEVEKIAAKAVAQGSVFRFSLRILWATWASRRL